MSGAIGAIGSSLSSSASDELSGGSVDMSSLINSMATGSTSGSDRTSGSDDYALDSITSQSKSNTSGLSGIKLSANGNNPFGSNFLANLSPSNSGNSIPGSITSTLV